MVCASAVDAVSTNAVRPTSVAFICPAPAPEKPTLKLGSGSKLPDGLAAPARRLSARRGGLFEGAQWGSERNEARPVHPPTRRRSAPPKLSQNPAPATALPWEHRDEVVMDHKDPVETLVLPAVAAGSLVFISLVVLGPIAF